MIILQSIRIRNFRAIAEATFKPLEEGITGIVGVNGAGKTTFLSGTMWALFGVRPPDAPVGSLRREGSTGECSVSVVFRHQKQQIEIIRELKGGGKSNHTVVNIYVDGVEQTVASVTAADQWITARLGVDATGFLTAFVIRQKELDQLITATASVRKALIERLAGVDTINAALKSAREDENQAKRILQSTFGSEQEVLDHENSMNLLADKYEQTAVNREALLARHTQLQTRAREVQGTLNTLRDASITQTRERERLDGLHREQTDLVARQESLAYVAALGPETGSEVEDLRQRYTGLTQRLNDLGAQVTSRKVTAQGIEVESNRTESRLADIDRFLVSPEGQTTVPETLTADLDARRQLISEAGERRAVLQSRITTFEKSIHTLGHSAECPTCHTILSDPEGLVKEYENTIGEAQQELASLLKNVTAARDEIQQLETLAVIRERVQRETAERETIITSQAERATQHAALLEEIAEQETAAHTISVELEEVRTLGVQARSLVDDRKTLASTVERLDANKAATEAAEAALALATAKLTAGDYTALEREAQLLQDQIMQNEPLVNAALSNASELETSLAVAKTNYRKAVDDWNRRKDLLKRQERLSLTTDLIDKFRRDTIASLSPEISDYATSLISEMTSGEFTDIKLDDEFNAFVTTSDGTVRAVSWLSGGELSAVALALRIAIGYLITGGNPELLWLDEVLTAQDADRRSSMLSLIRTLPIDQIIMINHTAEAADIVDRTITLNKDRKHGSYIADAE